MRVWNLDAALVVGLLQALEELALHVPLLDCRGHLDAAAQDQRRVVPALDADDLGVAGDPLAPGRIGAHPAADVAHCGERLVRVLAVARIGATETPSSPSTSVPATIAITTVAV